MLEANKLGALGALIMDRTEAALGELSPSAAAALSTLRFRPEATTTEIAAIAGVSQPTAVRLIDGLVRRGWVAREASQGRVTPLRLTDAGLAAVEALQARRLAAVGSLLATLPGADRARFVELLDQVLAGATTSRAGARTTCRLCEHALCGPEVCPIGRRASEIEAGARATGDER